MTTQMVVQEQGAVSAETMEMVVAGGDLSKLSPARRTEWYAGRCAAAGLDPRTTPFQYITLQGKLTLYATKTATDQLIARHKLTVQILEKKHYTELGIYEVQARVTRPDGSTVDDLAAVSVAGKRGDDLCNAFMKCVTKAKRRTVLSACGLGMLDESEIETVRGARRVDVDMATGEIIDVQSEAVTEPEKEPAPWCPTSAQIKRLYAIAKQHGIKTKEELRIFMDGLEGYPEKESELTEAQYNALCDEKLPALSDPSNFAPAPSETPEEDEAP